MGSVEGPIRRERGLERVAERQRGKTAGGGGEKKAEIDGDEMRMRALIDLKRQHCNLPEHFLSVYILFDSFTAGRGLVSVRGCASRTLYGTSSEDAT